MIPHSSISSFLVSSPTPLVVATPARAGRRGGATTVTPVGSPLAAWAWPTSTPVTSVIALRSPVGNSPTGPCRSRQRALMKRRVVSRRESPRPRLLEGRGRPQHQRVVAACADDLKAGRQLVHHPAGH